MPDVPQIPDLIAAFDLLGVFANGLLGGAVARRHQLDPVGFSVLAIISALGGGAIRDVLLDVQPVALTDLRYLTVALVAAGIAFLVPLEGRRWRQVFPWVDAVALGTWAVVGTQKALLLDIHWLPAILLACSPRAGEESCATSCSAACPRSCSAPSSTRPRPSPAAPPSSCSSW